MQKSRDIRIAGFTLIELMVSVAILAVLVILLSGVFGGVSKTWQLGQSNAERMQVSRAINDFARSDLRGALLPINRTDKSNLQLVVNPSQISSDYRNADSIFWQSPVASEQSQGDVASIGYFVKWDVSRPSNPRPALCRLYISEVSNPANFLVYSQNGGTVPWLTDAIIQAAAPADRAHAYEGLLAENVVAMFVQCLDSQGRTIVKDWIGAAFSNNGFDSRLGYTDGSGARTEDSTDTAGNKSPICVLPSVVRLSLVLIDESSARRITPTHRTILSSLAAAEAAKAPKGDASSYITAALADNRLKGIREGLRPATTEVNLLNAR